MVEDRWNTCIFFCSFPKSIYEMKCISKLYYLRLWTKLGGLKQQTFFWCPIGWWGLGSILPGSFQPRVSHEVVIKMLGGPGVGLQPFEGGTNLGFVAELPPLAVGRRPQLLTMGPLHRAARVISWRGTWLPSARVTPEMEGKVEASVSFLT